MVAGANHNNINKMKTTTKTQSPIFLKNERGKDTKERRGVMGQ